MDPSPLLFGATAVASAIGLGVVGLSARGSGSSTGSAPRPGWMARRKARKGIDHAPGQIGVGWQSGRSPVRLDVASLGLHGYVGGAPGSGKTTFLRNLISAYPGPVIVLDAKGSMDLVDCVYGGGGLVWEIGGPLKLDVLDDEPSILAQQLLEGETFTDRAAVYRAIAEHAILRAATVLRARSEPREPMRILELVSSPATLRVAIRESLPMSEARTRRWLTELDDPSRTMNEAFQTFAERLGSLLDSPAGESLGTGSQAIRLPDVLAHEGRLLIRLDERYGSVSRKVGAWVLVAMLRLAGELRRARWRGRCLFVVDEPRVLQHEGRHLVDLFGTARDAGIGLVVADQGVAGLTVVHPDMPDAVLRLTGWQMCFRQGSPSDAEHMSKVFGTRWRRDVTSHSGGGSSSRMVEERRVQSSWLLGLPTAHGWLRSAPIGLDAREQIASIVVVTPADAPIKPRLMLPEGKPQPSETVGGQETVGQAGVTVSQEEAARANVLRLVGEADADGCRHWRGNFDEDGRPVAWWKGDNPRAYRLLAKWKFGEILRSWDVHHTCFRRWCVEVEHLQPMPRAAHNRLHAEKDAASHNQPVAVVLQQEALFEEAAEGVGAPVGVVKRRVTVAELQLQGWSLRKIAEHLHVSYETVRRDLAAVSQGVSHSS